MGKRLPSEDWVIVQRAAFLGGWGLWFLIVLIVGKLLSVIFFGISLVAVCCVFLLQNISDANTAGAYVNAYDGADGLNPDGVVEGDLQ